MKSFKLFSSGAGHKYLLLMLLTLFTCGKAWGDETLTINYSSFSTHNTSYGDQTWSAISSPSIDFISGSATVCFYSGKDSIGIKNGHPAFRNTVALPGAIKSVTLKRQEGGDNRQVTLYVGTEELTADNYSDDGVSLGNKVVTTSGVTWALSAAQIEAGYKYFYFHGSSNVLYLDNAVITYASGGGGGGGTEDVYMRISSLSELSDGDKIIFVKSSDEAYACGTTQNTNNRNFVSITTYRHSYVKAADDNVQVFIVKINGSGQYGFHTGSGYIYSASSSSNNLKTNSTAVATAPSGTEAWNLSISENVISAQNVTNTAYYLQFANDYFSQYKSAQTKPYIYKKLSASCDFFIDEMHDTATDVESKSIEYREGSYSMPRLADKTPGSLSLGLHYKFVGWVEEDGLNDDGTLKSGYTPIPPGTPMEADLTTYYAIWDIE